MSRTLPPILVLLLAALPAPAQTGPDSADVHGLHAVEVAPRMLNVEEVSAALTRLHPEHLRAGGAGDTVFVKFIIGTDGTPSRMRVERAREPASGPPAVEAMSAARFSPALLHGQPVRVFVQQAVLWPGPGEGAAAGAGMEPLMGLYGMTDVEQLPRPPRIADFQRTLRANRPRGLRQMQGTVVAKFMVDTAGAVRHVMIVETPHEGLVEPTRRSLAAMRWQPATIEGGRPVAVWIELPIAWRVD
jgi:outer membrane biosynthesis protein TonB